MIDRAVEHLGDDRATRYLRKFYPWYVERLAASKALQAALQTRADAGRRTGSAAPRRSRRAPPRRSSSLPRRVPVHWQGSRDRGCAACVFAPAAVAQVQPYGTDDYGGFRNILPPGTNGFDDAAQLAAFEAAGTRPAHAHDQLRMYSRPDHGGRRITQAQIPRLLQGRDLRGAARGRGEHPEPRAGGDDRARQQFGVPHIYGDTRAGPMFGIGYATAEDRLFFIDVLRHSGQADLASFAGGPTRHGRAGVGRRALHRAGPRQPGQLGAPTCPTEQQILSDATNYVDGINAYIAAGQGAAERPDDDAGRVRGIGQPHGPAAVHAGNLVSIATLVGGIFGNGGGDQLYNAELYESMEKFGRERRNVAGSPELIGQPEGEEEAQAQEAQEYKG